MNNSIALMAPHSLPQTTIVLPNPKLSNDVKLIAELQLKEFMDGSIGTYTKTTGRKLFTLSFELTQAKDEELRRFVRAYVAETWRFFHWDNTVWAVHIVNPNYTSTTVAIDEYKEATLQLEGYQLS